MLTSTNILTTATIEQFLTARKKAATKIAIGVMLCILAAAPLLVLISLTYLDLLPFSLEAAGALGVILLLILVAIGVAFFIAADQQIKVYENWEYENCELSQQEAGKIQAAKNDFAKSSTKMNIAGTVLCIASAIPLLCGAFFTELLVGQKYDHLMTGLVAGTLALIAVGVFFFVKSNIINDSYDILLQTGSYTPARKKGRKIMNKYATAYWLLITLLYLGYSFLTGNWEHSWIIWPIAGVLYGLIEKCFGLKKDKIA